ncbi:OmpA family protein [Isoptericola sp. NEAU-Y5]|uniref:OmpA family protein n=1 Tax=Isoptericola luteus TaxID=2879484 RepID=A0ABS7ZAX8_9MICO|nr:OmpA family protein [Isoptericola sp. NEAU-Y5]MCA5892063.1 OmpA family protein [Isoptericola sp. NEAU-Y5]
MRTRTARPGARWAALGVVLVLAGCTGSGSDAPADDDGPSYDWPSAPDLGDDDTGEPGSHGDVIEHQPSVVHHGGMDVVPVQEVTTEGEETVVTLSSDILFAPSEAELSAGARAKVADLVADVPDGASIKVHGHTDTVDTDEVNQELSERRAEAVADAVRAAREDVATDVRGFGETRPKVRESGDEDAVATARAQNRRVEIRYGG